MGKLPTQKERSNYLLSKTCFLRTFKSLVRHTKMYFKVRIN